MKPYFDEIIEIIQKARIKVYKTANTELINLYWEIGKYITVRTEKEGWGKSTVKLLADYIQFLEKDLKGFSDKNLWRMKQFYEAYTKYPSLEKLSKEISWTNNCIIFSRCKTPEERTFYLNLCKKTNYTKRELERQISACYFERSISLDLKLSPLVRDLPNGFENIFKDRYVLEFLDLPERHSEAELQKGIVKEMKSFLLELGKDFLFVGEEFRLQVGNKDFFIDLLFYHRLLQCLVVIELKTTDFLPEHLGQLNFYLEALDRDVKNENENPSIGILLCKSKDEEVIEYALSRNLSPALVSQYVRLLPNKKLLKNKLNEILEFWRETE
jgi:predicted nuclease of restriction endonuclease-like (RecB) superfamily